MRGALRLLTLRHLWSHGLRTALTVSGVAIGTAALLGPQLLHDGLAASQRRTVERLTGKAALQVTNGASGVAEELVSEVAAVPGVAEAVPVVRGTLPLVGRQGEWLYVFAPDLAGGRSEDVYDLTLLEDELLFLAKADSIAVPPELLARTGARLGDRVEVLAPAGVTPLTLRAELSATRGPATLFGGRVGVMDVWAAQRLFALERRVSEIDVVTAPGADVASVEAALGARLAGRATVERTQARSRALSGLLAGNRFGMALGGGLALLVGVYLVFNTMTIGVAQRRRELGILRSLGTERRALVRLVAREAAVLGLAGGLLGLPLALGLAHAMADGFTLTVSTLYGLVDRPRIVLGPLAAVGAVVLAVVAALAGALVPAWRAAALEPLVVLRGGEPAGTPPTYGGALAAGLVVLALGAGAWALRAALPLPAAATGGLVVAAFLVGASLAAPAVVRRLATAGEPLLARAFGSIGVLAGRGLVYDLRHVAITAGAFVTSVASVVAVSTLLVSVEGTLRTWIDTSFENVDLMVNAGEGVFTFEPPPLPGQVADELAALPEVAHAEPLRFAKVPYAGGTAMLRATDTSLFRAGGPRRLHFLAGAESPGLAAVAGGRAVVVNDAFARRFAAGPGTTVSLPAPGGLLSLPVAGVFSDFGDTGVVFLDRALYRARWRDDAVSFVNLVLRPGADAQHAADAIYARWGARHKLLVLTTEQFRRDQKALVGQAAAASYPLIALGILVALLGVVNSLVATVLHHVRAIGMLRATGATRRQVARVFMLEAGLVGLTAGSLATVVGLVLGYCEIAVVLRGLFNVSADYHVPLAAALFTLLAAPLLSTLAGVLPARRAARFDVVHALRHD